METIRIQKYFTDCGVLSRRAAEEEIRAGRVRVNGEVAAIGQKIDPEHDEVTYRGVTVRPAHSDRVCLLLNKPRGYVTTLSDEEGRHTVAELVADCGRRVYPVGRLDMDSDGMLLLTDDGALANRLTHPAHEIPKYYRVTVRGEVSDATLSTLNRPFLLDGYRTRAANVTRESVGSETVLTFTLHEGRNRQIRRMCETVGLTVTRLTRVAIGNITLGDLPIGRYRLLSEAETRYLKGNENDD